MNNPSEQSGSTPSVVETTPSTTSADIFDSGSTEPIVETTSTQETPTAQETPATPAVAAPQPQFTAEQIAELAANAAAKVAQANAPKPAEQQAPGMSTEEFNKTFNVLTVDAKGFQDMFGFAPENPQQVANVNNAFQGAVKQAVKMATYLAGKEIEKLRADLGGQVAPIVTQQKNNREQALRQGFVAANGDLKDYMPLVETIAKQMVTEGKKFQSEQQLFSEVAKHVRGLLKMQPSGQAVQGTAQPTIQQPARQMASVSTGGQSSGAPTATSGRGAPSTAKALFS
jgi:hypothetical protein